MLNETFSVIFKHREEVKEDFVAIMDGSIQLAKL